MRYFATSFGGAACSAVLILLIQQFLAVAHHKSGHFVQFLASVFGASNLFVVLTCLLVVSQLLGTFLGYKNRLCTQAASEIIELGLMNRIIQVLLRLSVQFFKRQSEGDLVQAVRTDVGNMRALTVCYAGLLRSALMAVAMAWVVIWLNPLLAFISLVLLPLVALPLLGYSATRLRVASRRMRTTGYVLFDTVLQIISGIRIIKAYGAEEKQAELSVKAGQNYFKVLMDVVRVRSIMQVLQESVAAMSMVGIIAAGGYQITHGIGTWEGLVAFVFASRALFAPLNEIYGAISDIHIFHASTVRIRELLSATSDVTDSPNALPLLKAPEIISFDNVSFHYGGPMVLHNISFQVMAGETIGIVGPSGAGKSSLLNLIVRFYDPTAGQVRYDGCDLRDLQLNDVYRQMAIVTQDPFLFATTARENIRCGRPEATDQEVEEAAQAASMHEEILNLPNGYDTVLGMGGRDLSRGQAQRINVARALLRNSRLLLLDEATSSLDSVAEAQVQHSIDRLMEGRTCFIVAHRLSTLRNADRLIVLDRGACIGFGTHDELIRDCALYRQFWDLQQLGDVDMDYISSMLATPRQVEQTASDPDQARERAEAMKV